MRKVALVSWVKTKRSTRAPAQDLYVSPLFQKMRAWAEANCDEWFVLSALYGLVSPYKEIEPYERTLNSMGERDKREWAQRVHQQMQDAGLLQPGVEFMWLVGQNYKKHLSRLLTEHPQFDPLEGLKMGERLQWLNAHTS